MQMHRRVHREVSSDRHLSDQKTKAVVGDMDGSPRMVHGDCPPRPCAECTQEHGGGDGDAGGSAGDAAVGAGFHLEKG